MPLIPEESKNKTAPHYKQTYRNLKRKLKILIYENEYYQEELKKYQKQLLNVNRDKCFLMEKLLKYEDINSSSSDSDATESSESEIEIKQERPSPSTSRRRRLDSTHSETAAQSTSTTSKRRRINSNGGTASTQLTLSSSPSINQASSRSKNVSTGKKNNKGAPNISIPVSTSISSLTTPTTLTPSTPSTSVTLTSIQAPAPVSTSQFNISVFGQTIKTEFPITQIESPSLLSLGRTNGQFTPEEIERHFESRPVQPSLLLPEKTPLTVPVELFSNESSHDLPELNIKTELPND